jgi:hypothetical protein
MKKYLKLGFLTALLISCNGIVPVVIATAGGTPNAPTSTERLQQLPAQLFNSVMQKIEQEMYRLQEEIQQDKEIIQNSSDQSQKKRLQPNLANTQKSLDDLSAITKMKGLIINPYNNLLADSKGKTICIMDDNTLQIPLGKKTFRMDVTKLYEELGFDLT